MPGTAIINAFPQAVALVQSAMSSTGSLEAVVRIAPVVGHEFLVTLVRSGTKWQANKLIADGKPVGRTVKTRHMLSAVRATWIVCIFPALVLPFTA